jgi:hypothetical protein
MTPTPDLVADQSATRERVRKMETGTTAIWPRTVSGRSDPEWTILSPSTIRVRVVADVVWVAVREIYDGTTVLPTDYWPLSEASAPLYSTGTMTVGVDGTLTIEDAYSSGSDGLVGYPFKGAVVGDAP